ncbi:hypothetical protein [uncultured Bacteroides sp.]|uniref:hypothetical protein n=1 Tax=uncultured Bacteroides sp. TaxID=162156 RepID=UPI0025E0C8ED|nr:hypothetical protein [uncultured Bacteroides sp.]
MVSHRFILSAFLLLALAACNNGVFIDDYLPHGVADITMSEDNRTTEITFAADNWGIDYIDGAMMEIKSYTLDGKETYLPFKEKELGVLHCKNEYVDFRIEKNCGNKLKISYDENLYDNPLDINIFTSNAYKTEEIKVRLAPTSKYRVDSVVYDWKRFDLYEYGLMDEMDSFIVDNTRENAPVTIVVYPYRNSRRELRFYPYSAGGSWEEEKFRLHFGDNLPEITIPDIIDQEKPVLGNTKIPFGIGLQYIAAGVDKYKDKAVEVTIGAHDKRKVLVFNYLEQYVVPLKVYASNPISGGKREFSAFLHNRNYIYTGNDFIFKQKIE